MANIPGIKLLITGIFAAVVGLSFVPVSASSANISHSYRSRQQIAVANIVSLDSSTSGYVEAASTRNAGRLYGVVVAEHDSLLAVDETAGQLQVANGGNANALVSTLNGPIKLGDQIAVSPFSGIGMKAEPGSRIIGLAQTAFDDATAGVTVKEVVDKSGKKNKISVGLASISIAVGVAGSSAGQQPLSSLQRIGKSLTGHTVSNFRVIVSLTVAGVAMLSLVTLIYASIYGGIISVGRNPLAKYAVLRTLGSVMVMVVITAGIAGLTIFLLLR